MDMSVMQAFVLGVVQGIGEFLPISSSAHLIIVRFLFNFKELEPAFETAFDVALHFGTLIAVLFVFWKDWLALFKGAFLGITKKEKTFEGRMFWYLVAATIPGGAIGFLLDHFMGDSLGKMPLLIASALIIMGIVLYIVDKKAPSKTKYEDMTFKQSFLIGLSQAIAAAFPGTSRSGITMTVARALKVDRESAAKYSFLLSTPIVLAAVLVSIKDFEFTLAFFMGVLFSFLVGIIVIKFLLNYLKKGSFKGFAIYRVILGIIVITMTIMR